MRNTTKTLSALVAAVVTCVVIGPIVPAQSLTYTKGQNIAPAYEGWERDADGSKYFVFGYMNRNWVEEIDLPPGAENSIMPGGPDQGQPTHFLPRRNRFVFRVPVPKTFTEKDELVWTITVHGGTEKAWATLRPDYLLDDVVKASETGALGAGTSSPEVRRNKPPAVRVDGSKTLTATVGQPLTLTAWVTDDGIPKPRQVAALAAAFFGAPAGRGGAAAADGAAAAGGAAATGGVVATDGAAGGSAGAARGAAPAGLAALLTGGGAGAGRGAAPAGLLAVLGGRGSAADIAAAAEAAGISEQQLQQLIAARRNPELVPPARITVGKVTGLHLSWFVYRGAGKVTFTPEQVKPWEDTRAGANSPWAPLWTPPVIPAEGKIVVQATFAEPGTYVLRSLADDGALFDGEDVTVTVTR